MYSALALASLSLLTAVRGQQIGTNQAEVHPSMAIQTCTSGGVCTSKATKVVIDANWRWLHSTSGYTNCYTGNTWNTDLCPDPVTCATNCALEGANYESTYGITTPAAGSLKMKFVTKSSTTNIGSRVYLLADDDTYQTFSLKNNEFTFDVDVSNLPCGLNGALYFSQMDADGGKAKNSGNKAGARYGTGYCDAQCPHDMKFINGEANTLDWTPSTNDVNAGSGRYGTCCTEMDIWEANKNSAAYTPHTCTSNGLTRCSGTECGDGDNRYGGICDKDGCDFNSYRMGDTSFLGPGKKVDTNSVFTVVTQFITADNTATGVLKSIRRFYVQNGVVLANSYSNIAGVDATNEITDTFCKQQKVAFGDTDYFSSTGGMTGFSTALDTPMVLSLSIWDDHTADMKWLDSTYPVGSTKAGAVRGTCDAAVGAPTYVEATYPDSSVTFSNIKFGPIGSTFNSGAVSSGSSSVSTAKSTSTSSKASSSSTKASTSTTKASSSSTKAATTVVTSSTKAATTTTKAATTTAAATATGAVVAKWGQCGGTGWTGSTNCVAGTTCTFGNAYYSQCL